MLPRLGNVALQELRATDLDAMYAELLRTGGRFGKGLSLASVHHVHAVLNKMLNDAERKGLVMRNVARLANAPSMAAARARGPEMKVWSPAELADVPRARSRATATKRCSASLALTGMRRSEVVGLRWSDVDLDRRQLTVNQAVTVVDGEEHIERTRRRAAAAV